MYIQSSDYGTSALNIVHDVIVNRVCRKKTDRTSKLMKHSESILSSMTCAHPSEPASRSFHARNMLTKQGLLDEGKYQSSERSPETYQDIGVIPRTGNAREDLDPSRPKVMP